MDMQGLTGSVVALVTPFLEDGSIDYGSLERLVDFHLENGTDGILVLGTTGESSTMTDEEDLEVAKTVIDRVAGRIPVIGGAGSNSTAESLRKAKALEKLGADGLLLITPYYNKSNEEGIYRHFTTVLDQVDVPCLLYNIPGRTGCSISERNVARLATHPNAWGIKEASGNISYATMVARYLSDDFRMMSGNDDMVVPILSLGGVGVVSVWADVAPRTVHDMCAKWLAGDTAGALKVQLDNLDLVHALFGEVNPIPVKAALAKMGLIGPTVRLPLWQLSPEADARLEAAMKGLVFLASVLVVGAKGRMGTLLRAAVEADANLSLAGGYDADNISELDSVAPTADLVIDFSAPASLPRGGLRASHACGAALGHHWPLGGGPLAHRGVGAGGPGHLEWQLLAWRGGSSSPAREAAASLTGCDTEIVECHHNRKADAPSGTAKMLLEAVDPASERSVAYGREGIVGPRPAGEIGMHSLRGGTVAGTHEVLFFGDDEEVVLTHRATSRQIFVNGAISAAKRLLAHEPGFYDFDTLMFG